MALMADINTQNNEGESKTWNCLKDNLPDNVIVYHNRSINSHQYDFCLLVPNMAVFVIEVKGWSYDYITSVKSADEILLKSGRINKSPYKQAQGYKFGILKKIQKQFNFSPLVLELVCYPNLTREDFISKKLNRVSDETMTIFKEELENPVALQKKIQIRYDAQKSTAHDNLTGKMVAQIRHSLEPDFDISQVEEMHPGYSRLRIYKSGFNETICAKIVKEYFEGIKEYVFITSGEDMKLIMMTMKNEFLHRNLKPVGSNIEIGRYDTALDPSASEYKIFNFETYLVDNAEDIDKNRLIEEGKCGSEEKQQLIKLSEVTSFNYQQYAVEHAPVEENILVKAGAGTGKTYSMVSRISFLCNKAVDPVVNIAEDIAMITFTDEASENMKRRVKKLFMNYFILTAKPKYIQYINDLSEAQITTIHKFAFSLIHSECIFDGLSYDSAITNEVYYRRQLYQKYLDQYIHACKEENSEFGSQLTMLPRDIIKVLMEFSKQLYSKNVSVLDNESLISKINIQSLPHFQEMIINVMIPAEKEYQEMLKDANRLSLDQCIIQLNKLLNEHKVQETKINYKYIFVDEFQDTDDVQIDSIAEIRNFCGKKSRLFIVGDLKQSIYRFRGATLSAFDHIQNKSEDWTQYYLNRNYRTDHELLEQFDKVFRKLADNDLLPYTDEDKLVSSISKDIFNSRRVQKITIQSGEDLYDTLADSVKKQLQYNALQKLNDEDKTIAILVRYNDQAARIKKELGKRGVEVITPSGGDLYKLTSTIDLYKLVLALSNPTNEEYLANLIESNYIKLRIDLAEIYGMDQEEKLEKITDLLDQFFELMMDKSWNQIVSECQVRPVLVVLKEIYQKTMPWKQYSDIPAQQKLYKDNYECLIERIVQRFSRDYLTINMVEQFLNINVTAGGTAESRRNTENNDSVQVFCMTIHKAKGLEFGTVIMPHTVENISSVEKGLLTVDVLKNSIACRIKNKKKFDYSDNFEIETENEENRKEEARLLYVALTRTIRNFIWIEEKQPGGECWDNYLEAMNDVD